MGFSRHVRREEPRLRWRSFATFIGGKSGALEAAGRVQVIPVRAARATHPTGARTWMSTVHSSPIPRLISREPHA